VVVLLELELQQGCPGPPQVPVLQLPLRHVPGRGRQLAPLATQRLAAQQPLSEQLLPGQHTCPGPPQVLEGGVVDVLPPLETTVDPPLPPLELLLMMMLVVPARPLALLLMMMLVVPARPLPELPATTAPAFAELSWPPCPAPPSSPPPGSVVTPASLPPAAAVEPALLPTPYSEDLHPEKAKAQATTSRGEINEDQVIGLDFCIGKLLVWRSPS
jgi:hypothetical protein